MTALLALAYPCGPCGGNDYRALLHYQGHRPNQDAPNSESCGVPAGRLYGHCHSYHHIAGKCSYLAVKWHLRRLYTQVRYTWPALLWPARLATSGEIPPSVGFGAFGQLRQGERLRRLWGFCQWAVLLEMLKALPAFRPGMVPRCLSAYLAWLSRFCGGPVGIEQGCYAGSYTWWRRSSHRIANHNRRILARIAYTYAVSSSQLDCSIYTIGCKPRWLLS